MIPNNINPRQILKFSKIIFFSLITGLITFLVVVLSIIQGKLSFNTNLSDPLMIASFILSCIVLPAGYLYAKMTFSKIDPNELLRSKLPKYQSVQIFRLATCEGVGMLALVSFLFHCFIDHDTVLPEP
jgi:hypothetical protein